MHSLFILLVISFGTLPIKVKSTFYLEFTVDEQTRNEFEFKSRNLLFKCAVAGKKTNPQDKEEPPIHCALITLRSELDQIYSSKNFWIVWRPKLLYGQKIIYVDSPFEGLPDSLFLAVSYDPLDYPDFKERNENDIFGNEPDETDFSVDGTLTYHSLCNVGFMKRQFDFIKQGLKLFHQTIKKSTNEYWESFSVTTQSGRYPKRELMAQKARYKKERVNDEIQGEVAAVLMKMIDPCFIKSLVDGNNNEYGDKGGKSFVRGIKRSSTSIRSRSKRKERMSSADANEYCNNFCRYLAVAPLVLRKVVDVRCHDLTLGQCAGNTCMCAKSKSTTEKVSMAECNNRVISVSGTGLVERFPPASPNVGRGNIADVASPYVNSKRRSKLANALQLCNKKPIRKIIGANDG